MKDGITAFIREHAGGTDIFCFQEVYPEMRHLCEMLLPNYREFSAYKFVAKNDDFSQATFVRKNIEVKSSENILAKQINCGLGINVQLTINEKIFHVCNFHGLSMPGDKLDNRNRLKQSQGLLASFKGKKGPKIIGGDFNLLPNTRSIEIFEESGYKNLIKDFSIKTTRNRLSWEKYPGNKQYFSDYVFISPEIKVKSFSVPENENSDHLPMILEAEI